MGKGDSPGYLSLARLITFVSWLELGFEHGTNIIISGSKITTRQTHTTSLVDFLIGPQANCQIDHFVTGIFFPDFASSTLTAQRLMRQHIWAFLEKSLTLGTKTPGFRPRKTSVGLPKFGPILRHICPSQLAPFRRILPTQNQERYHLLAMSTL